jgi:hypothetical protein
VQIYWGCAPVAFLGWRGAFASDEAAAPQVNAYWRAPEDRTRRQSMK